MLEWTRRFMVDDHATSHRQEFLEEFLRLEGRGDLSYLDRCSSCLEEGTEAVYRCGLCYVPHLECQECCVQRHAALPFHFIEVSYLFLC